MPEKYTQNRPVQGGNRVSTQNSRTAAQSSAARPQAGTQTRRPAAGAQPGTAPRRPVNPQSGAAGPQAGTQARRPAAGAQPGTAPRRPASQQGTQARRPSQAGTRTAQRSAQPVKRPAQRPAAKKRRAAGGMSPGMKGICGVLCVALLITICLAVTSAIRARDPQPVIAWKNDTPHEDIRTTAEPQNTDAPVETQMIVSASTDAPQPTDAPAEPQATDVPQSNPIQNTGSRSVTIRAIGDVIIDKTTLDNCKTGSDEYDFSPLFELVGGVMSDADWTMINIEASLRKHKKYGYMGYPQFCTPHSILYDLKDVGVDMLTMCNNHALDNYFDGLKMGVDYADEAGLAHVGAYRTQQEHDTPEVYDIGGIKVGMLNYTQYTNGMANLSDEAATIYGMRLMDGADYEGDIADLKNAGAEVVICIMHWGAEYVREPESDTKSVARRLVAAGADLVIGGHPHVVQPVEYLTATQADGTQNTALVAYSIGNFVSEHRHENAAYTDNGVIFEFTLRDNGAGGVEVADPAFIPVYMWHTEGAGAYEFRAVPSGVYLDNPPQGMSDSQHKRMKQSWNEIVDLVGGVIPVVAE